MIDNQGYNLNDIADDLGSNIPEAPNLSSKTSSQVTNNDDSEILKTIIRLQEYERNLVKLDRLFISRGLRFVLIIPILVMILYGLANSFIGTEPDWWVDHVYPVIPIELSIEVGFYYLAFFFIIADLGLLSLLLLLISMTRRIFNLQSKRLTKTGLTFKSAHGYAEMKETIEGSFRQVSLQLS